MNYKILDSYLPESEKHYYESSNPGWEINTTNCLQVTFEDGTSSIYVIFDGPWTKANMCRDCGSHYELLIGNQLYKFPHNPA